MGKAAEVDAFILESSGIHRATRSDQRHGAADVFAAIHTNDGIDSPLVHVERQEIAAVEIAAWSAVP